MRLPIQISIITHLIVPQFGNGKESADTLYQYISYSVFTVLLKIFDCPQGWGENRTYLLLLVLYRWRLEKERLAMVYMPLGSLDWKFLGMVKCPSIFRTQWLDERNVNIIYDSFVIVLLLIFWLLKGSFYQILFSWTVSAGADGYLLFGLPDCMVYCFDHIRIPDYLVGVLTSYFVRFVHYHFYQ